MHSQEYYILEEQINKIQRTLEWMIEGMINAQCLRNSRKSDIISDKNPLEEPVKKREFN